MSAKGGGFDGFDWCSPSSVEQSVGIYYIFFQTIEALVGLRERVSSKSRFG